MPETTGRPGSPWSRTPVRDGVLDLWVPPATPRDGRPTTTVVVPPEVEHRPDLFAHRLWGDVRLWWVPAVWNPDLITDPIRDLRAGLELVLPTVPPV